MPETRLFLAEKWNQETGHSRIPPCVASSPELASSLMLWPEKRSFRGGECLLLYVSLSLTM